MNNMIEIKCTSLEKKRLIQVMETMRGIKDAPCLFPRQANFCALDPTASCRKCLETKIKWTLTDAKKHKKEDENDV